MKFSFPRSGTLLIVAACMHILLSVAGGYQYLAAIVGEGFFNTVRFDGDPNRMAVLWAIIAGLLWIMIGSFWNWFEHATHKKIPPFYGWFLAVSSLIGAIVAPVGGFWIIALIGAYVGMSRR